MGTPWGLAPDTGVRAARLRCPWMTPGARSVNASPAAASPRFGMMVGGVGGEAGAGSGPPHIQLSWPGTDAPLHATNCAARLARPPRALPPLRSPPR